MIRAKTYNIADSNLANFGTEIEYKCKQAAAQGEPAWQGLGQKEGLFVWRIEKFHVVAVDSDKIGQFHTGDSYIVLNARKKVGSDALQHDIHFWLGDESSQDEIGTAAYKTVELDDFLGRAAVQHRETQNNESPAFLSLFPPIAYLEGGIESGFRHVERKPLPVRLFRVKGEESNMQIIECQLRMSAINHGDSFVIDAGSDMIHVFHGRDSSQAERQAASSLARAMRDDRGGRPELVVLSDTEAELAVVEKLLDGKHTDVGDVDGDDAGVACGRVLVRLNDGEASPLDPPSADDDESDVVVEIPPLSTSKDEAVLYRDALDHLIGFKKGRVAALLTQRTRAERYAALHDYATTFKRDLGNDIRGKLMPTAVHSKRLVTQLLVGTRAELDARILGGALGVEEGGMAVETGVFSSVDQALMMDVLAAQTKASMDNLIAAFQKVFRFKLADAVQKRAVGGGLFGSKDISELAVALLSPRSEAPADAALANEQAERILKATEKKTFGSDHEPLVAIFAAESLPQIKLTVAAVMQKSKHDDFRSLLKSQRFTSAFRKALLLIHHRANGTMGVYYARRLYKSMKGLGTNDNLLGYILCRVDEEGLLDETKAAFYGLYGKTLTAWVREDSSGFYRKLLMSIIGKDDPVAYGAKNVTFGVVATGADVKRSLLATDDVFVLDSGISCFAWVGKQASPWERRHALQYAQLYCIDAGKPPNYPITRVFEGSESGMFDALIGK